LHQGRRRYNDGLLPQQGFFIRHLLAFTLVELLTVMAIITVLITVFYPAVQESRETAQRTQCANNINQLATACQSFHDVSKAFPAADLSDQWASWAVLVLPYLDRD
jgi:prepilin-type N-terminal cleavage/methylation domain-containing protein